MVSIEEIPARDLAELINLFTLYFNASRGISDDSVEEATEAAAIVVSAGWVPWTCK